MARRFGGVLAVDDASLEVAAGEIVALIGPNGSGKTTLFALIAGYLAADRGEARFLSERISGMAPYAIARRGLVRTFQIMQPFAGLTVRENIAVGAHLRHPSRAEALARAAEVARRVGMTTQLDRPARALTVAGRKRLELARALATEPKLLLLDEVMAGLNPAEIDEIVAIVREIRQSGVTIFLIEHVMQAVMSLSQRVYVLANGRVIASGEPARVASDPAVIEAYLGKGAASRLSRERQAAAP